MSTIVLRSVKGSPLTNTEVDNNFTNLNNDKLQVGGTYSAGTANGVLFLSASKVLTTGSALTFDGTNFATTGTASATKLIPTGNVTAGNGMYLPAANTLAWSTNGSERMRIDSSGNVGIGTSSPSAPLTIKARASDSIGLRVLQSSAEAASIQFTNDPVTAGWATFVATSTYLQTASAGLQRFDTGGSERMRITSAGNVGIGTSNPGAATKLNVAGRGLFTGGAFDSFDATPAGVSISYDAINSVGVISAVETGISEKILRLRGNSLQFFANNSERMRIDASGNLVLGTTTALGKLSSIQNFGNGATATSFTACALGTAQGQLAGYSFRPTFVGGTDNGPRRAADIWSGFSTAAWGTEFLAFGVGRGGAGNDASNATIERMRIDGAGNVLVTGGGGLGYGVGSGGAVTQATSRTTGVTLNGPSGAITLVSAAGSATYQSFTVTNSKVAATDTIIISQKSGTDLYITNVTAVAAGSFRITFATTGGTTTEQPVFNFAVIKAATT
jgi:hypothetical protein